MSKGNDKLLHVCVCFLATILVSLTTIKLGEVSSIISGSLFALGLGLGKEYGDSKAKGNKWDWWDIVADVLGIAIAVVVLFFSWRAM